MLKGHADIYLTDAKTGEVVDERHEDNIVTNAVQDLISMNPWCVRGGIHNFAPFATSLLGGVLLFPETVPESATDYWAHGQWPTGYASNESDPNGDPRRGNFNPNESYATSNGYRLVWDFGTADANGDISAVCLTNTDGGKCFEISEYFFNGSWTDNIKGIHDTVIKLYNQSGTAVVPDAYHNGAFYKVVYATSGPSSGGKITSLSLLKWAAEPHRQPLARTFEFRDPTTVYVDVSELHISASNSMAWDESGLRILSENYNNGGYDTFYATTIGWDGTTSEVAISKGDMTDILKLNYSVSYVYGDWCYLQFKHVENSEITYGFYAIDLTNTSNINELASELEFQSGQGARNAFRYHLGSSIVYSIQPMWSESGNKQWYWICALDEGKLLYEFLDFVTGGQSVFSSNYMFGKVGPYRVYSYGSVYLVLDNTYLATINNLAAPITKTADKTLKIVYTLTEA